MFTRLSSVIEDSPLRPRLLSIVFYRNQQHLKDLSGEDGCWFQQMALKVSVLFLGSGSGVEGGGTLS